jgi:AbrB family looped-hinge helix DNA binding protein
MKEPNVRCQGLDPHALPARNALLALTFANWYYKMPIEGGLMETRLDKFGRVVLPKDIRDHLDLKPGQVLKVERADEEVILKPVEKELPLHIKNGVLVFSGAVTGDITKTVKEHREGRLKKISLLKCLS